MLKDILKIEQTGAERRQYERTKLIVDIHYEGGEGTGIAATRDFGIGGLYLVTDAALDQGATLLMRMTIGKEPPQELILKGIVTYADHGQGVGIRFQNLSKEAEDIIKKEIEMQ